MSVHIDAHAHWYPAFDPGEWLRSAARGFGAARGDQGAGMLLVADPPGIDTLGKMRDAPAGWRTEDAGAGAVELRAESGERVVVIAGKQRVSREGIEVLSLACAEEVEAGRTLAELVREIAGRGGVPVVPWGFGKWWGARGRVVRALIEQPTAGFFLGDSRGRVFRGDSSLTFEAARRAGVPVLHGTDPLPLASQAGIAGSFGSVLEGAIDIGAAAESVRGLLKGLVSTPPMFGKRASWREFAAAQAGLRVHRRDSGAGAAR
jgi:hypothetical protein